MTKNPTKRSSGLGSRISLSMIFEPPWGVDMVVTLATQGAQPSAETK